MKKYILPILLLMMFIPFAVNAETCDTDKISISSITVESKSDGVEELDEATTNGRNINFNLSMSNVGDNIEYKIVVKNDSNEDYELDKNSFNISSDYIKYTLESENDTNIVKANSSKLVYLKINYANEVPDDAFESGTYNENKLVTLNLSTGDTISVPDTLKNPNTVVQSYILIVFTILLISISAYVLLRRKKYVRFMILIVGLSIVVPISVYALCKYDIRIESNVKIEKKYSVYYVYPDWLSEDEIKQLEYYDIKSYNDFCANEIVWCTYSSNYVTNGNYSLYMVTIKDNEYKENTIVDMKDFSSKFNYGFSANNPISSNIVFDNDYINWLYIGTYDEIEKMNFLNSDSLLGVYYNDNDKPYSPFALLNVPQKFTMPKHDIIFYTFING